MVGGREILEGGWGGNCDRLSGVGTVCKPGNGAKWVRWGFCGQKERERDNKRKKGRWLGIFRRGLSYGIHGSLMYSWEKMLRGEGGNRFVDGDGDIIQA